MKAPSGSSDVGHSRVDAKNVNKPVGGHCDVSVDPLYTKTQTERICQAINVIAGSWG